MLAEFDGGVAELRKKREGWRGRDEDGDGERVGFDS